MTCLYGAGGHAKVIIEILENSGETISMLFDDNTGAPFLFEYPIKRFSDHVWSDRDKMILAIGNNAMRKKLAEKIQVSYGKAIHGTANLSSRCYIGDGSVVMAGATVNSCAVIGRHCVINTNASVDHDCILEDYVHISPNVALCGNVVVGEGAHIGAGAVVIPGVRIGSWAIIGAGAVVVRDVENGIMVKGNPAISK